MKRKVVFFDRDGTLIEDKIYLNDPNNIIYLPGVLEMMKNLRDAGYEFIIVTNQSGIARDIVQVENLTLIHQKIRDFFAKEDIQILDFYYAPFLPSTNHYLRKPSPGMLMEGALNFNVDLKHSWMIGDRMTDVEAGHRAGTRSILLSDLENPKDFPFAPPEFHVHSLEEVTRSILENPLGS